MDLEMGKKDQGRTEDDRNFSLWGAVEASIKRFTWKLADPFVVLAHDKPCGLVVYHRYVTMVLFFFQLRMM